MKSTKMASFCRIILVFTSLLFINPSIYVSAYSGNYYSDYDWYDFGNDSKKSQKTDCLAKLLTPHNQAYQNYLESLELWTSYTSRDRDIKSKLRILENNVIKEFNQNAESADRDKLISLDRLKREKENKMSNYAEFCSIKMLRKHYNGGKNIFKAVGSLEIPRQIFLKNYELFGEEFTLHHSGVSGSLMGFSDDGTESEVQKLLREGVNDLMILKGKNKGKNDKGVNFCYDNVLANKASTLGASLAIKDMMLRATTNVTQLNKRASAIKAAVSMLENPETAERVNKQLAILRHFEDDFLGMKDSLRKEQSVLADNIANIFFPAARLFQEFKSSDNDNLEEFYEVNPQLAKVLDPLKNALNDVNSKVNSSGKKMENWIYGSNFILSATPFWMTMRKINDFQENLKGIQNICGMTNSSEFGFTIQEIVQNWNHPTAFAELVKRAGHQIFVEEYKKSLESLDEIFKINPKEEGKKWLKNFANAQNLWLPTLIQHIEQPVLATTHKCNNIISEILKMLDSATKYFPSNRFRNLLGAVNMITQSPVKISRMIIRDITEVIPNAFNNSYEQLIGVRHFFNAAKELTSVVNNQKFANLTGNLKLFSHLKQFSNLTLDSNKNKTLLDKYRIRSVAKIKQKIKSLQKEISYMENGSFTEKEFNAKRKDLGELQTALPKFEDNLLLYNTNAVCKLLNKLESKVFRQRASFFRNDGIFHIGEVTSAYRAMFNLQDHFYPMYQALSELLAIFGIAKKIIDSKNDPYNKYCIVNFEENRDLPHIKVVNGWNPTAIPDPRNGFDHIVPSSFELGGRTDNKEHHMLLTGPNGKGKSTFMRGATYQIWTAQTLGIAPAESMSLTPFHFIFSLDKNVESAEEAESTHMKQVKIVKELINTVNNLAKQKKFSWINCDEMYNGTDTYSASALIILFFTKVLPQSLCCVATHHREAPVAEVKTNGLVVCYKINPDHKSLEKGIMNVEAESTNLQIMKTKGCLDKDIKFVAQCVREFTNRLHR